MKFLYPWQKLPRWSLTGKKVYKVMKKSKRDPNLCYSAQRLHPYVLGVEQFSIIATDSFGNVTNGLHTFPNLSDAIVELNKTRRSEYLYDERPEDVSEFTIYECLVPRGARYYRGVWEYYYPDYKIPNLVTNRLTIVKEIKLAGDAARLRAWNDQQARKAAVKANEIPSDLAM